MPDSSLSSILIAQTKEVAKLAVLHLASTRRDLNDAEREALASLQTAGCESAAIFAKSVDKHVARCELGYRSMESTDEKVCRHKDCFGYAVACSKDMSSPPDNKNGYGGRFGVSVLGTQAKDLYGKALDFQKHVIAWIDRHGILRQFDDHTATYRPVLDASAAYNKLRDALSSTSTIESEDRRLVMRAIMGRAKWMNAANRKRSDVEAMSDAHVKQRVRSGACWIVGPAAVEECTSRCLEYVDYRSVSACLRVCRDFSKMEVLKKLLPHLSVRHIPGVFPHTIEEGVDGPLTNYVAKNTLSHVYADLAITGKVDCTPERVRTTKTHAQPLDAQFSHQLQSQRSQMKYEAMNRNSRTAAEEEVNESDFRRRLSHETFFSTPIECTFDLVFADDKRVVSGSGLSCLRYPRWMTNPSRAPTSTFTALDGVPYPAHGAFYIDQLSNNHASRKFMIRVTGNATTLPNENGDEDSVYSHTLVAYSRPFELVSHKPVSKTVRSWNSKKLDWEQKKRAKMNVHEES